VIGQVVLEWLDGVEAGRTQEVAPGSLVFGRGEQANVVLATGAVSRAHARLDVTPDAVALEDLKSANGTAVNGQRISGRVALNDGDEFTLGDARRFRVRVAARETQPPVAPRADAKTAPSAPGADQEWRTRLINADELPALVIPSAINALAPPSSASTPDGLQTVYQSPNLAVPGGVPQALAEAAAEPMVGPVEVGGSGSAPGVPRTMLDSRPVRSMVVPKLEMDGADDRAPEATRVISAATVAMTPGAGAARRIASVRLIGAMGTFTAGLGRSIVGRGADAAVRIDSRELSRVHAAITVSPTEVLIEDLESTNGTTVNGLANQGPCRLVAGDRVAFGTIELAVEILPEGAQ
jgi:pSer/pThr/pTyr-binding forkhead associated (FHA) protein